jgi:hypothetical protein
MWADEMTYMYQKLIHQLYSFRVEPSFRVEGLGIIAKNILVTMDHPCIDAETGLKMHQNDNHLRTKGQLTPSGNRRPATSTTSLPITRGMPKHTEE